MKKNTIIIILLVINYLLIAEKATNTFSYEANNGKMYTLSKDVPKFLSNVDDKGRSLLDTWFYYGGDSDNGGFKLFSQSHQKNAPNYGEYYFKGNFGNGRDAELTWAFYVVDGDALGTQYGQIGHYAEIKNSNLPGARLVYVLLTYTKVNFQKGSTGDEVSVGDVTSKLIGYDPKTREFTGYPFMPAHDE